MKAWHWLLVGVVGWLAIAGLFWVAKTELAHFSLINEERAASARDEDNTPLPKGHPFTRVEANTFLDAAEHAEKIADPLQRCLAYPDPPGSHWDHATVVAYCKYRYQPTITFEQVKQMVQSGRARELDRMFDAALRAQMTDPDARGRLDRIFINDFGEASFEIRSTLDAWKRQSPDSAFAWAASGYEYDRMAVDARGDKYISKTPQSAIDAMDRLAQQADADLKHALALNPKITPAYAAMVSLGGMTLGNGYALDAARRGLAQEPEDFYIYEKWMWLSQPNWGGSLAAMTAVADDAQKHADRNPLLRMLAFDRGLYRIDRCKCAPAVALSAYEAVLDGLPGYQALADAGSTAKDASDASAMTIWLSEALRFNPDLHDARLDRIYGLVEFDVFPWAIAEADTMIARSPDDEYAIKARGWAYMTENDLPQAERDFKTATELDPDDMWALSRLGGVYLQHGQQWDKAWDVASRLVEKDPGHLDGWVMRATIQAQQPRPGLKETADYLESHFYTDRKNLQFNAYIAHLRAVIQGKTQGTMVLESHG